jgi:hypothetical protein
MNPANKAYTLSARAKIDPCFVFDWDLHKGEFNSLAATKEGSNHYSIQFNLFPSRFPNISRPLLTAAHTKIKIFNPWFLVSSNQHDPFLTKTGCYFVELNPFFFCKQKTREYMIGKDSFETVKLEHIIRDWSIAQAEITHEDFRFAEHGTKAIPVTHKTNHIIYYKFFKDFGGTGMWRMYAVLRNRYGAHNLYMFEPHKTVQFYSEDNKQDGMKVLDKRISNHFSIPSKEEQLAFLLNSFESMEEF